MKKITMFFILMAIGINFLFAQDKTITGVVTGAEDGFPIPGVTIYLKSNPGKGTISDIDGNYSFTAPVGAVLVFSFVGMEDSEITVGESTSVNVAMNSETEEIEEVQVVGYGTKKKKDNTGSQSTVKADDLPVVPTSTLTEGLQGAASGLRISSNNGTVGASMSVNIRGIHSVNAGSDPLWIIDGVPMHGGEAGQDPMSLINQNDIESIDVLKDAKATAIYGSRGSNGVILITTKSGKQGKCNTTFGYTTGVGTLAKSYKKIGYANTNEYFQIADQAINTTLGADTNFNPYEVTKFFQENATYPIEHISRATAENTNTNWFEEVLRISQVQDVNFSTSCGFDKGSYYVSANYKDVKGVLENNNFKSMNTRMNLDYELFENVKMGSKMSFGYTNNQQADGSSFGGSFGKANRESLPWFPINSATHPSGYWNPMSGYNIAANNDRSLRDDRAFQYRGLASTYIDITLPWVEGLKIRSEVGLDFLQSNDYNWYADYMNKSGSFASDQTKTKQTLNYNVYGNYNKTFAEIHNVDITLGTESQSSSTYKKLMEARNITTTYHYLGGESAPPSTPLKYASNLDYQEFLRAYFGRADYKLKNRYIVGISFRRDGSSKFKDENRWGTFTAYSLGWIISEESFFNLPAFNTLKLRGSFGQTGNKNIDASVFDNIYSNKVDNVYGEQSLVPGGTLITNIGNPEITWETTNSYDVGIDFALLQNRFDGSIAYYVQNITDMLLKTDMPSSAPVDFYWKNVGAMRNNGIEFNISSVNMHKPLARFKWTTDFNISTNNNEITKLNQSSDKYYKDNGIIVEGQKYKAFYIAEWAGLDEARGIDLIWEIDQNEWETNGKIVKTGRKIAATKTNLENNRVILEGKSTDPTYFGGLTNKFEFKNFDLNILVTFAGGNYIYDYVEQRGTHVGNGTYNLRNDLINNAWTPTNTSAKYPQVVWNYNYPDYWNEEADPDGDGPQTGDWQDPATSNTTDNYNNLSAMYSRYLYKGDYVRLKNIQLGYNMPKLIVNKMRLKSLRVFTSVSNVAVWALEYKGWDPETGESSLPPVRMYNFGVNVGL